MAEDPNNTIDVSESMPAGVPIIVRMIVAFRILLIGFVLGSISGAVVYWKISKMTEKPKVTMYPRPYRDENGWRTRPQQDPFEQLQPGPDSEHQHPRIGDPD
jgi:hypothetical protein